MPDQTPAETLRAAATLMRERAKLVPPSPWHAITTGVYTYGGDPILADCGLTVRASYAASWHPLVALAVADWLDRFSEMSYCYSPGEFDHALAIACAYLGSTNA